MDAETLNKIAQWKAAALSGTFSQEDQREAVRYLRGIRKSAAVASTESKARKKASAAPVDTDSLFGELLG
jgi:DNA topoisomerase IA